MRLTLVVGAAVVSHLVRVSLLGLLEAVSLIVTTFHSILDILTLVDILLEMEGMA